MDIWKGSVTVPYVQNTTQTLDDLSFSTPLNGSTPASSVVKHLKKSLSTATLSFLRYLPPSSVPFFLAAGPSLHVATTSPTTDRFLQNFFRGALPKREPSDDDYEPPEQSKIALLLQVDQPGSDLNESATPGTPSSMTADWGITEVLIYGSISYPETSKTPAAGGVSLSKTQPTPPNSSPDPPAADEPIITYQALPLSSRHNFHQVTRTARPPVPVSETPTLASPPPEGIVARFVAPNPQDILNPVISATARKRRAEALDKAVEKKTKKAKPAPAPPPPLTLLGPRAVNSRRTPRDVSPTPGPERTLRRQSTKRDISAHFERPQSAKERPQSIKRDLSGSFDDLRQQSLKRDISGSFDRRPSIKREISGSLDRPLSSHSIRPVSHHSNVNTSILVKEESGLAEIETRDNQLAKDGVLAAMKNAGMRDYRRQPHVTEDEVEEYKGVYKQAYKAVLFAFRKDIKAGIPLDAQKVKAAAARIVDTFMGLGLEEGEFDDGPFPPRLGRGESQLMLEDTPAPVPVPRGKKREVVKAELVRVKIEERDDPLMLCEDADVADDTLSLEEPTLPLGDMDMSMIGDLTLPLPLSVVDEVEESGTMFEVLGNEVTLIA